MNKKTITLISSMLVGISITQVGATVSTVAEVSSINNKSSSATYKLSEEKLNNIAESIPYSSNSLKVTIDSTYKNIQNYKTKLSWLLEHDILSKDLEFTGNKLNVVLRDDNKFMVEGGNASISKSDLVMALCKAYYGVQESRPIIIQTSSKFSPKKEGDVIKTYNEGDYEIYITPNVYENYFVTMLDKGFLSIDEFKNPNFISSYNKYGKEGYFPAWFPNLGNINMLSEACLEQSPLGDSISIKGYSEGITLKEVSTTLNKPNYFSDENILKIDALKLIESVMRVEEGDMTELEAKICTYKYGAKYLSYLNSSDKNTVMYLIAMGILDFENEDEFKNLYDSLDQDFFQTVLYRIANKNARKDFSKITLTDSDNYWLENNMFESEVKIYDNVSSYTSSKVTELKKEVSNNSKISFLKSRETSLNSGKSVYSVEKTFKEGIEYLYRLTSISNLSSNDTKFPEVKEVKSEGNNKIITFEVEASDSVTALAIIDSRITLRDMGSDSESDRIDTVCKVSSGSGDYEYFIPKSVFESNHNTTSMSEISAISDKVLVNNKTGVRAVFLEESKMALVGNEIINTDDIIVRGINQEVYYNLNIIVRLMSNSYIDNMWIDTVFRDNVSTGGQKYLDIKTSTGNKVDRALISPFLNVRKDSKSKKNGDKCNRIFISLNHTTQGLSYMFSNINKKIGKTENDPPTYMVVSWKFVLPDSDSDVSSELQETVDNFYETQNPDVAEMSEFLTTKPNSGTLLQWWDTNIALSDALCNFIYGTKDISYFNSGYLAPSVTILTTDSKFSESNLDTILNKLSISSTIKTSYVSNGNIRNSLFAGGDSVGGTDSYKGLVDSRKLDYCIGYEYDNGKYEYGDYVLSKTNNLYKSINPKGKKYSINALTNEQNPNRDYAAGAEDILSLEKPANDYYLKLTSRDDWEDNSNLRDNEEYTINGKKYRCMNTVSKDNVLYKVLDSTEYVKGSYSSNDGEKTYTFSTEDGKSVVDYQKSITGDSTNDFFYVSESDEDVTCYPPDYQVVDTLVSMNTDITRKNTNKYLFPSSEIKGFPIDQPKSKVSIEQSTNLFPLYYKPLVNSDIKMLAVFSDDKDVDGTNDTTKAWELSWKELTKRKDMGTEPYEKLYLDNGRFYNRIYLNEFNWCIDSDGNIQKKARSNFLIRHNLRSVSVTEAVIDSILSKNYEYSSVSSIPKGKKVVIGDLSFTKGSGNTLISDVITNTDYTTRMSGALASDDSTDFNSLICSIFDGSNISIIDNGFVKSSQALVRFIDQDSNGGLKVGIGEYQGDASNADYVLCSKKGENKILNNGSYNNYSTESPFNGFCFYVKFSNKLKFRPLDKNGDTWTLVYQTNEGADGDLRNIPFFTEDLDYAWDADMYDDINQSNWKIANDFDNVIKNIRQEYKDLQFNDIYNIIKSLVVYTLTYLLIVMMIVYVIKKINFMRVFLQQCNEPNGGHSSGIDFLRIITLGLSSIEIEDDVFRFIFIEMTLSILLWIVFKFI